MVLSDFEAVATLFQSHLFKNITQQKYNRTVCGINGLTTMFVSIGNKEDVKHPQKCTKVHRKKVMNVLMGDRFAAKSEEQGVVF